MSIYEYVYEIDNITSPMFDDTGCTTGDETHVYNTVCETEADL